MYARDVLGGCGIGGCSYVLQEAGALGCERRGRKERAPVTLAS
jgi:hypothetical protein